MVTTTFATASKQSTRSSFLSSIYDAPYLWYVACAFIVLAYYALYFNYDIDLDDEGFLIGGASAIRSGQFPVADFRSYEPWMYFFLSGFFRLFGETLLVERAFLIIHLLVGVLCLLWLARKVLPPILSLIPVALYAVAPGPWYKVFFIFHLLIGLCALLLFGDRPNPRRALLVGLATGFALISRAEAGVILVVLFIFLIGLLAFSDLRLEKNKFRTVALRYIDNSMAYLLGILVPTICIAVPYFATGKFNALIAHLAYYSNPFVRAYSMTRDTTPDVFDPRTLFSHPKLEQWVYAVAMITCLSFILLNLARLMVSDTEGLILGIRRRILLGTTAIGSMGYTFFYVWNSRMLSTFAIVILAVVTLLYDCCAPRSSPLRFSPFAVGCVTIAWFIALFSNAVHFYSGSITVLDDFPKPVHSQHPFLKGAIIYAGQDNSIELLREIAKCDPNATLVPMTYATTMGYLSGLRNPTYYRLFTGAELSDETKQKQAIETFEQFQIKYFVARRGEFSPGEADPAALALAEMPLIKDYVLSHYDLRPLGENYVILVRRKMS